MNEKRNFRSLKLNTKFTILITGLVFVTIVIFSAVVFRRTREVEIEKSSRDVEDILGRETDRIHKLVESVNICTQFFLGDNELNEFLNGAKTGEVTETPELLDFYHKDISVLERMVNSNPYMYQVRVYADSDEIQEMMPILYRKNRMERLEWGKEKDPRGWKFGYGDAVFKDAVQANETQLTSLVTPIEDYRNGKLGVLEASITMETMFPEFYEPREGLWFCFIDRNGNWYSGKDDSLLSYVPREWKAARNVEEAGVIYREKDGRKMVIGVTPLEELSGILLCVEDVSEEMAQIGDTRNLFAAAMGGVLILMAFLINLIVKRVLRQFYDILKSIRRVQKGDLNVVIENCGSDEMGELGTQINKMLTRIRQLMEDNIKREVLVKNAEIRSLQNQINAHFIYNVLETIKMMAEIDGEYEISDAVTSLGKLLRYSMKWTSGLVSVEEEINYIRNYLLLMNLRFDYEIYLSLNIPEEIYRQEIPKMSLQPLVENAICHGISELAQDTNIYIKGRIVEGECLLEVSDSGNGMSPEKLEQVRRGIEGEIELSGGSGNGIGLKNVQDRIRMNYGEKYGLEIASMEGCYTKVSMRVPAKKGIPEERQNRKNGGENSGKEAGYHENSAGSGR